MAETRDVRDLLQTSDGISAGIADALFRHSPFSSVIFDANGHVLAVNDAFTQLAGITAGDLPPGYTVLRDPQLDALGLLGDVRRAFAGERVSLAPMRYDTGVYSVHGRLTWSQGELHPVHDDDGAVTHVVLVQVDLTARVAAEDALRATQSELSAARIRLETILNGVSDGITVQDARGDIVYANDAAARAVGYNSAAEFERTPLDRFMQRFELRDELGQPLSLDDLPARRALLTGEDSEAIIGYSVKDSGEEFYTLVRARRIPANDGDDLVVNIFHDITQRTRQQHALEEAAAQLEELATEQEQTLDDLRERTEQAEWAEERAAFLAEAGQLLASSLDYEDTLRTLTRLAVPRIADWCTISMLDAEGEIRRLEVAHADPNRLQAALDLERSYPPKPEDSGVHRVARSARPELISHIPDEMLVAAAQDEEHLRLLRELGLRSVIMVPLIAQEKTLGVLTLIAAESGRNYGDADLTFAESLASRAALAIHTAELYHEAREANRAKAKFLAVMSHELRTPLNAILGYTDLLAGGIAGETNERQDDFLRRISSSAQHLTQLIETVLAFARIEAGKEEARLQDVDIGELVADAVTLIAPAAEKKQLDVRLDVPQGVVVRTDVAKTRQILLNLLSNAVKFTDRGSIAVAVEPHASELAISVTDTGVGIAGADIARIWEPFTQLDSELTRRVGGTGLGLPVSASLAELLGGRLTVESTPARGSTFTLHLPQK